MIKRNYKGEIVPYIKREDGRLFFIAKYYGKYYIMEQHVWLYSSALLYPWIPVDPFESMVKAFSFLKKNIDDFM